MLARVEGRLLSAGPGALIRLGLLHSVVGRAHALEAALGSTGRVCHGFDSTPWGPLSQSDQLRVEPYPGP